MNAVSPAPTLAWKQAFAAIVLVELALIALYFETAQAMVGIWWRSETFNHAFLVPPIAFWLIFEKRDVLQRETPRPSLWLTLPLIGLAIAWLLGELAVVNAITFFSFVGMLVLVVPLVIGVPTARCIAFPLMFFFFAVPFGEFVMPKMMEWTAIFTVAGLRASGIPVYQEGLHFVIPSGKWSVVEACSGVRYLIASIVVGTLYAYINYQSIKRRLIFVGISILVPLVANWVRAYLIVMLGHYSGNQLAVGADHLIYGWVFFGVVIVIMFAIGMRWREPEVRLVPDTTSSGSPVASSHTSSMAIAAVLTLGISFAPHAAISFLESGPELPQPMLSAQSLAQGGWEIADGSLADWQPSFANPAGSLNAVLAKDGRRIGIFIAYYRQQSYARKLISSGNALVKSNDKAWSEVGRDVRQAKLAGQPVMLRTGVLRSNLTNLGIEPERIKVWYWYWIDGKLITSDHLGKFWLALSRLSGHGDESAAVFVYAQEPDGDTVLADFLTSAGGGIASLLEQAAAQRR